MARHRKAAQCSSHQCVWLALPAALQYLGTGLASAKLRLRLWHTVETLNEGTHAAEGSQQVSRVTPLHSRSRRERRQYQPALLQRLAAGDCRQLGRFALVGGFARRGMGCGSGSAPWSWLKLGWEPNTACCAARATRSGVLLVIQAAEGPASSGGGGEERSTPQGRGMRCAPGPCLGPDRWLDSRQSSSKDAGREARRAPLLCGGR